MMGKNWGCDSVVGRGVGIGGVISLAHMMGFDGGLLRCIYRSASLNSLKLCCENMEELQDWSGVVSEVRIG